MKLVLWGDEPLANAAYVIKGLGDDISGTTGPDGSLSVEVPVDVDTFLLELTDQQVAHQVLVRHLDPITEDSGLRQRLSNLGHGSALWDLFDVEPSLAIWMFQLQDGDGTPPTGTADDDTIDAIQKAHGT